MPYAVRSRVSTTEMCKNMMFIAPRRRRRARQVPNCKNYRAYLLRRLRHEHLEQSQIAPALLLRAELQI